MPRDLRADAFAIFDAGLRAADPAAAVERSFHPPADGRKILVAGAGKASARMAQGLERILGSRITGGLINVKDGHTAPLRYIELNECSHPVPDERGVAGAKRIAELCAAAGPGTLIICLISGGASALMPLPVAGITLAEKQETTRLLLACGATIHEMNAVRKHLSAIKGGRLAALAAPAQVISLILSDVIGDDLAVIGSGPTAPDPSTFTDALSILDRYKLRERVPAAVRTHLEQAKDETPKHLDNATNIIAGSNRQALQAATAAARDLGYPVLVLSSRIEGETRDIARMHAAIIQEHVGCVLSGGETTVTIRGAGLGGRNQEFALAAAIAIDGMRETLVLSAGTDGTDGPTDAAGAWSAGDTVARSRALGMDAQKSLDANDSYRFFEALGDLVKTGPTGTNVMDLRILLRTG